MKAGHVCKAKKFVEKPDLAKAKEYLKSGLFLWNCGIFIFKINTILDAVKKFKPEIYRLLKGPEKAGKVYKNLPDISIDYAVMEKASNIYCVKCDHEWNDIGSFEVLKSVLRREGRRFSQKNDKIMRII